MLTPKDLPITKKERKIMRKIQIPMPMPSKEDFKRGGQTTRTKWQAGRNRLGEAIKVKPETIKPEVISTQVWPAPTKN